MNNAIVQRVVWIVSLSWLTGPIFDKELRVSSRRRRNYVLRSVHIVFFTLILSLIWVQMVRYDSNSLYRVSRMGAAGQAIILYVVWFQFIAAQIIGVVMLSTAISDEIYNKTLGLLMTTPVGSFQVVLGKLLSRLLQLILLLGITLPLLAIVRVFGGVPWGFLLCGLFVTLTTAVFLASLSLFFSIFTRRAYTAIIETVLVAGGLFALVPMLVLILFHRRVPHQMIVDALAYTNPYIVLSHASESLMVAGPRGLVNWPAHCGVAMVASVLLLVVSAVFVRKVALRQATGQSILFSGKRKRAKASGMRQAISGRICRVIGPPVFWKERRIPLFGKLSVGRIIMFVLGGGFLILTYILCARENALDDHETHALYAIVFASLGILFTMILPATCITVERESQAWPILLTTTVSNWDILWGKFLGAVRRCSAVWLLLFAHLVVFSLFGVIHPIAILQFGILVGWITFFLCGTGLYFSTRFKRTTTAVIANIALAALIWAIVPLLLGLFLAITRSGDGLLEVYVDLNPFVHTFVVADATARGHVVGRYDWAQGSLRTVDAATGWMVFNAVMYIGVALLFLGRAWSRMRRDPV